MRFYISFACLVLAVAAAAPVDEGSDIIKPVPLIILEDAVDLEQDQEEQKAKIISNSDQAQQEPIKPEGVQSDNPSTEDQSASDDSSDNAVEQDASNASNSEEGENQSSDNSESKDVSDSNEESSAQQSNESSQQQSESAQ